MSIKERQEDLMANL